LSRISGALEDGPVLEMGRVGSVSRLPALPPTYFRRTLSSQEYRRVLPTAYGRRHFADIVYKSYYEFAFCHKISVKSFAFRQKIFRR
jgi:hypothetical protein